MQALDRENPLEREILEFSEEDIDTQELKKHKDYIKSFPCRRQKTVKMELREKYIKSVMEKQKKFEDNLQELSQETVVASTDPLGCLDAYSECNNDSIDWVLKKIPHPVNKYVLGIIWNEFPNFRRNNNLLQKPLPTEIISLENPEAMQIFIHKDQNNTRHGVILYKDGNLIRPF
ncbi:unnamed protein product [Blepharisma stoltei]|uniref:Uncharacterized protein n=1 Tax=Blepharisma stoltei TaxID=1481888 RepID=A0AAU9IWI2_9CILI|nr:unnamed protein product [Blepharisma stoltei]